MAGPLEDAMTWMSQQGQKRNEERLKKEDRSLYEYLHKKKNERPAEIKQGRSKESRQLAREAGAIVTNEDVEKAKKQQEILFNLGYPSFNGEITPENYQYAKGALDSGRLYGDITNLSYTLPFHVATGNAVNSIVSNAVRLIPKAVKFTSPIVRPIVTGGLYATPGIIQAADGEGMTGNKPLDIAIASAIGAVSTSAGAGALYVTYKGGQQLIKHLPKATRYVVNAIKNNPKATLFTTIPLVGGTVGGIVGANMYDEEPQTEVNINQEQPTSEISQAELDSLFINNKR